MSGHALLSPSKSEQWMNCAGSIALGLGLRGRDSTDSKYGTAAHEVGALCLESGSDAEAYLGRVMSNGVEVDQEMVEGVQMYVDFCRNLVGDDADDALVQVEVALDIEELTHEKDARGTADFMLLQISKKTLTIVDLKFGKGVRKDAPGNPQLKTYGSAAFLLLCILYDIEHVRVVIHQPRLLHVSDHLYTVEEIREFIAESQAKAAKVWHYVKMYKAGCKPSDLELVPGDEQCRFCVAKHICPQLTKTVLEQVPDLPAGIFEDLDAKDDSEAEAMRVLSTKRALTDLVRAWADAIDAETYHAAMAGKQVPNYMLVLGKRGNKVWEDEAAVQKKLKAMKVKKDQMFKQVFLTPTQIEGLVKAGVLTKEQWADIEQMYSQAEGKPTLVKRGSTKKPEFIPEKVAFEDLDSGVNCATVDAIEVED